MQQHGSARLEQQSKVEGPEDKFNGNPNPNQGDNGDGTALRPAMTLHSEGTMEAKGEVSKITVSEEEKISVAVAAWKGFLPRSESDREQCRVCQQQTQEPLMDLGCGCRGELSKAHRPCIEYWFCTRSSNKCEICQQVAVNIPLPDSQSTANYCAWRVDPAYGVSNVEPRGRARGCITPLWVAFAILIGGLLLDVLLSILLGVSALPVNIIIGVLIMLGLGTAFRLALECCHEWGSRRHEQGMDIDTNTGYHPAV